MSDEKPMKAFSTPSREVRGPQDLVARMNEATSDDWETVPFPARQQLGYHERLFDAKSGNGVNEYWGKAPQDLVQGPEHIDEGDNTARLSSIVGYHLEATEPPAEPAGAPGSAGYNQLVRNVPAADGYELDVEHTLTHAGNGRVLQFAPGQGLSEEEQARVDGAGPFIPAKALEPVDDDNKYGTVNGILHGHPETWEVDFGGTKAAAEAADGAPKVETDGGPSFVEAGEGGENEKATHSTPDATAELEPDAPKPAVENEPGDKPAETPRKQGGRRPAAKKDSE